MVGRGGLAAVLLKLSSFCRVSGSVLHRGAALLHVLLSSALAARSFPLTPGTMFVWSGVAAAAAPPDVYRHHLGRFYTSSMQIPHLHLNVPANFYGLQLHFTILRYPFLQRICSDKRRSYQEHHWRLLDRSITKTCAVLADREMSISVVSLKCNFELFLVWVS